MTVPTQFPEMSASTETQELQEFGLYELHDSRHVPELPSLPVELDASVSGKAGTVSSTVRSLNNGGGRRDYRGYLQGPIHQRS